MEAAAKVTAKGQVTIPKAVREALGLREGDSVVFRVDGRRAIVAPTRNLLDLAGAVSVPAAKRGTPWDTVRKKVWVERGRELQSPPSSTPTSSSDT
jgi:antitoxin PrlF